MPTPPHHHHHHHHCQCQCRHQRHHHSPTTFPRSGEVYAYTSLYLLRFPFFGATRRYPTWVPPRCAVLFIFDTAERYPPPCCVVLHLQHNEGVLTSLVVVYNGIMYIIYKIIYI